LWEFVLNHCKFLDLDNIEKGVVFSFCLDICIWWGRGGFHLEARQWQQRFVLKLCLLIDAEKLAEEPHGFYTKFGIIA
jgi:hypothetical protein